MDRRMEKRMREREELKDMYSSPENKGLRYSAYAVIAVVIAIQLAMIMFIDKLSTEMILLMRGCVGTGAIIFVILVGIMAYRVNSRHLRNRRNTKHL